MKLIKKWHSIFQKHYMYIFVILSILVISQTELFWIHLKSESPALQSSQESLGLISRLEQMATWALNRDSSGISKSLNSHDQKSGWILNPKQVINHLKQKFLNMINRGQETTKFTDPNSGTNLHSDLPASSLSTNLPPVAIVGEDLMVRVKEKVLLNGAKSYDPEGEPLLYRWSFLRRPLNSLLTMGEENSSKFSFSPDVPGVFVVSLMVSDPHGNFHYDHVDIEVLSQNMGPSELKKYLKAKIELKGQLQTDKPVLLSAKNSRFLVDGKPPEFDWYFIQTPDKIKHQLTHPKGSETSFIPTIAGSYLVGLRIKQGIQGVEDIISDHDELEIKVTDQGLPVAVISVQGRYFKLGQEIIFSAKESFSPLGGPLNYQWSLHASPLHSKSELTDLEISASLSADVIGPYGVELIVVDQEGNQSPADLKTVEVIDETFEITAVIEGGDTTIHQDTLIVLNGRKSYSTEDSELSYTWKILKTPDLQSGKLYPYLDTSTPGLASFKASVPGMYRIGLTVSDGMETSAMAQTWIMIQGQNEVMIPIANAGPDQKAFLGTRIQLDASSSEQDDADLLNYYWRIKQTPSGSNIVLQDKTSRNPSFEPDLVGRYDFTLNISRSDGVMSDEDEVSIFVYRPHVEISERTAFLKNVYPHLGELTLEIYYSQMPLNFNQDANSIADVDSSDPYARYYAVRDYYRQNAIGYAQIPIGDKTIFEHPAMLPQKTYYLHFVVCGTTGFLVCYHQPAMSAPITIKNIILTH